MNNDLVSVVIINFNSGKYIFKCLDKLKAQTYKNIEIIIIDNCSTDGSDKKLEAISKKEAYYYFYSHENMGASKANNMGINNSHGKYVLVLNADMFLETDYIDKCINIFKEDSAVGTVVGKFLSVFDHRIIDSAGIEIYKEGMGGERGIGEIDHGQYDKAEYIAGACCAAAIYRREMLDSIKYKQEYFDEDFFAFIEDVDLSVRALLKGWKTFYRPDAIAYHVRGGSTKNVSDAVLYLAYRNRLYFYEKTFKHFDIVTIMLYSFVKFIRFMRIKPEFRRKARADLKEKMLILKDKRECFSQDFDYAILKDYTKKIYFIESIRSNLRNVI
jgi:GT2 family glycosyltransferase